MEDVILSSSDRGEARALSPEAVAFLLEMGLCPGSECPHAKEGCDPRCPHLQEWVRETSGG